MGVDDLIEAVKSGQNQPEDELALFVGDVATGKVSTEEATRWLKAVHKNGLPTSDTVVLTQAMIHSGAQLAWPEGPPVVDKHSTGGVGDKMSLMLAPALAACGCRVPMLAGRGLGHTGGTIDKLESIPGFNCALTPEEMVDAVANIGCCIAVQNEAIAPADGVLYALRDVTETIDSVPLINASIISKKAAEGLDALVLDVKTGPAAFMQSIEDARTLARSMVNTAEGLGIRTVAQITAMGEPIGTHIGNALEVIGSIHVLQGKGSADTRELVVFQGAALLSMTHDDVDMTEGRRRIEAVLNNGKALDRFRAMCIQQGVDEEVASTLISTPERILGTAASQTTILAEQDGYVAGYDAMRMAQLARRHGAGRFALEDTIDDHVGFILQSTTGTPVGKNTPLFTFFHSRDLNQEDLDDLKNICKTGPIQPENAHRLLERIDSTSTKA